MRIAIPVIKALFDAAQFKNIFFIVRPFIALNEIKERRGYLSAKSGFFSICFVIFFNESKIA